jgi:raffinose/stachyose/melibiose transport system permease protein
VSVFQSRGLREAPALSAARQVFLVLACLVTLAPIVLLYLNTFKSLDEFFANPYGLPRLLRLENYVRAWQEANVAQTMTNSLLVMVGGVLLNLLLTMPASYAFARLTFRLRPLLFVLFIGGLVVPEQLITMPLLLVLRTLNIIGTLPSLICAYAAMSMPMAVLFLSSFFRTVPLEIEEAARVDGATTPQLLLRIVLPIARPGIATVAILIGVWIWNDFIISLIVATQPTIFTLPLGIMSFFGVYSTQWTLAFASVAIAATPFIVAYFFLTRQFMEGLSAGATHG